MIHYTENNREQYHQCEELTSMMEYYNTKVNIFFAPILTSNIDMANIPQLLVYNIEDLDVFQTSTQIDFCPFCGKELAKFIRQDTRTKNAKQLKLTDYHKYLQRINNTTLPTIPISESRFKIITKEVKELELLIPHAKHPRRIKGELRRLNKLLCISSNKYTKRESKKEDGTNKNTSDHQA